MVVGEYFSAAVKAKAMRLKWRAAAGLDPAAVHMQKLVLIRKAMGAPEVNWVTLSTSLKCSVPQLPWDCVK